jgi:alpha-mannosidase
MYVKNFDHTLERQELFLNGKVYKDSSKISIKSQFYFEKKPFTSLKVIKNTGRFVSKSIVERINEFQKDAHIGDHFGSSWTTHWFKIDITVPDEWLDEDKEVHLLWNGKCEAAIYTIDGARLLSAITENVREIYLIKRKGIKDDLKDLTVN